MTTDITELTPEAARESGSILIIVAARMARREFFTPLHALCESGKRVVSTRMLCDAVERAEEHMVSQVSKIVDGHDRLTKKLKEAESRNAELVEALEKAQTINAAAEKLVRCKGRYHSEQNYRALAAMFGVTTPDLPPMDAQPAQPCEHSMFWDASGVRRCSKCDIPEHANVHYADAAEMEIAALRQRIAELDSFRTAYMEWSDKTDWVRTDRRFDVVKPLGKHLADVLKAYIEHLESRTVKLPAVEKWRKPDAVRAQNAYRVLVINDLAAAGIKWEAE